MLGAKNKLGYGFDIVSNINKIVPEGIELHTIDQGDDGRIRKSSFTGPNTNLKRRLKGYIPGTGDYESVITEPINKLDRAAMKHDLAYSKYKDLQNRHNADMDLLKVAEEVIKDNNSTFVQKFNANLVKLIMKGKIKLGVGYGGNLNPSQINELVRQAQQTAQSSNFQGNNITSVIAPLLYLAGAIGIPATISLFKNKIGKGHGYSFFKKNNILMA